MPFSTHSLWHSCRKTFGNAIQHPFSLVDVFVFFFLPSSLFLLLFGFGFFNMFSFGITHSLTLVIERTSMDDGFRFFAFFFLLNFSLFHLKGCFTRNSGVKGNFVYASPYNKIFINFFFLKGTNSQFL